MFDFLKFKKNPEPIFQNLGTDMHCHLIPGVDDGSKSLEETLHCLRVMQQVGYSKVYITPHFQFPRFQNKEDDIKHRFENLKQEVAKCEDLHIELMGIGGEYRIDDSFANRMAQPQFLTVGGGNPQGEKTTYLLLELSLHQQMFGVEEQIFEAQTKGYEVILAHPERYPYLSGNATRLETLKNQGVLFQLNVLSLSGFYGRAAMEKGFELLHNGWVELLGTDMHNTVYASALLDASRNHKIKKVLETHTFLNSKL